MALAVRGRAGPHDDLAVGPHLDGTELRGRTRPGGDLHVDGQADAELLHVVGVAPAERAGSVAGLVETSSELGGALGMALLGSVMAAVYRTQADLLMPEGLPAAVAEEAGQTLGGAVAVAAQTHPHLIMLDLGMPRLDGIEVIQALRGWTNVPIIVVSGRTGSADKVDALDAGADDFVTKPFQVDELLARAQAAGGTARRRAFLLLLGLFGAALFYGDSVITPAMSVLSAVEGLEVVDQRLHLELLDGTGDGVLSQSGGLRRRGVRRPRLDVAHHHRQVGEGDHLDAVARA